MRKSVIVGISLLAASVTQADGMASAPLNNASSFLCAAANVNDVPVVGSLNLLDDAGQITETTGERTIQPGQVLTLTEESPSRRYCTETFDRFVRADLQALDGPGQPIATSTLLPDLGPLFFIKVEYDEVINGVKAPHLLVEGANVHIRSGAGFTADDVTGLGNLIVGYNEPPDNLDPMDRMGSHNLVTGIRHRFPGYGSLLAGIENETSNLSSVSGGIANTASALGSSVSGGDNNRATMQGSSVSGGSGNTVLGASASVSGGTNNTASGASSHVSGGLGNVATALVATVAGGSNNSANSDGAAVAGGTLNTASGQTSSIGGGIGNVASGVFASIAGGAQNTATGEGSAILGGSTNMAEGQVAVVSGGSGNVASGLSASVSGGGMNLATGGFANVSGGMNNDAQGDYSSILGGQGNIASGLKAVVTAGVENVASGDYSSISGGVQNTASGEASSIGGGGLGTAADPGEWLIVTLLNDSVQDVLDIVQQQLDLVYIAIAEGDQNVIDILVAFIEDIIDSLPLP